MFFSTRKNALLQRGFLKDINPMDNAQQNKLLSFFSGLEETFKIKFSNFISLFSPVITLENFSAPFSIYIDNLDRKKGIPNLRVIDANGKSFKFVQTTRDPSVNYQVSYTFMSVEKVYNFSIDSYGKTKLKWLILKQDDKNIFIILDNTGTIKFHFNDSDFEIKSTFSLIEELRLLKAMQLFDDFSSIGNLEHIVNNDYITNCYWFFKEIQQFHSYTDMKIVGTKNRIVSTELVLENDIIKVFGFTDVYSNETCYHRRQTSEEKKDFITFFERL